MCVFVLFTNLFGSVFPWLGYGHMRVILFFWNSLILMIFELCLYFIALTFMNLSLISSIAMIKTQIKLHRYGIASVCYLKTKSYKSNLWTPSDSAVFRTELRITLGQGYTAFFLLKKKSFLKDYMKLEMQVWKLQRISTGYILQWVQRRKDHPSLMGIWRIRPLLCLNEKLFKSEQF